MTREVTIVIHDDLDHSPGAETYVFAWGGVEYEIDLTESHFKELHELLRPYLEAGRPQEASSPTRKRAGLKPGPTGRGGWQALTNVEARERRTALGRIRTWAREQGHEVGARAQIPIKLHDAYNLAHPDDQVPNSKDFRAMMRERERANG